MNMNNKLQGALTILSKNLRDDKDLYYAYQSNIAMPFMDEYRRQGGKIGRGKLHQVANVAAKQFLDLMIKEDGTI